MSLKDLTHPQRVRYLYKMILRLHRSLPQDIRDVGDKYVREEFKKHKNADSAFIGPFMIEWSVSSCFRYCLLDICGATLNNIVFLAAICYIPY